MKNLDKFKKAGFRPFTLDSDPDLYIISYQKDANNERWQIYLKEKKGTIEAVGASRTFYTIDNHNIEKLLKCGVDKKSFLACYNIALKYQAEQIQENKELLGG